MLIQAKQLHEIEGALVRSLEVSSRVHTGGQFASRCVEEPSVQIEAAERGFQLREILRRAGVRVAHLPDHSV